MIGNVFDEVLLMVGYDFDDGNHLRIDWLVIAVLF